MCSSQVIGCLSLCHLFFEISGVDGVGEVMRGVYDTNFSIMQDNSTQILLGSNSKFEFKGTRLLLNAISLFLKECLRSMMYSQAH